MMLSECLGILESKTGQEEIWLAALDCSQLTEETGQDPNLTTTNPEAQESCSITKSSEI